MEDSTLEQTWWHIEDQLKPSKLRIFRQVMDVYTNKDYLKIPFEKKDNVDIFGLQVKARNKNQELAFIVKKEHLLINLGNSGWPIEIPDGKPIRGMRKHVKVELEYMEQYLEDGIGFKSYQHNGYEGYFRIESLVRPEFIITVPRGMKISDKGKSLNMEIYQESDNNEVFATTLTLPDPIITNKKGKNIYIFAIADKDQKALLNSPPGWLITFSGSYHVDYDPKFWALPAFAFILVVFSLVVLMDSLLGDADHIIKIPDLGILIALFSFSFLILSLHREKYEIPLSGFIEATIGFSGLVIASILLLYLLVNDTIGFLLVLLVLCICICVFKNIAPVIFK